MSHAVTILGCCILLFTASMLALGLGFDGAFLSMGRDSAYLGAPPLDLPGVVPFGILPLPTRAAYAATFILDTAPVLFVLSHLSALLRLYAGEQLLGPENGRHVRRIAFGLAAYAFAPVLGRSFVLLAGHGVDNVWFHASSVHALLLAVVLFMFGRAMDAGYEAQQDRDGFV